MKIYLIKNKDRALLRIISSYELEAAKIRKLITGVIESPKHVFTKQLNNMRQEVEALKALNNFFGPYVKNMEIKDERPPDMQKEDPIDGPYYWKKLMRKMK